MRSRPTLLFISANPLHALPIDTEEEMREIKDLAGPEARFRFETCPAARFDDVVEAFRLNKPEIVHISSHGAPLGEVLLKDTADKPQVLDLATFLELFGTFGDSVRLVVLNACNSEHYARSLATRIDCVFGVAEEVADKSAVKFSKLFYRALVYGANVHDAYLSANLVLENDRVPQSKRPCPIYREGVQPETIRFFNEAEPDRGLQTLASLASQTHVRELVSVFRSDFETADRRLNEIGSMKALHDWLHRLQLEFHAQLPGLCLNFSNQMATDELVRYVRKVRRQLTALTEIVQRPLLSGLAVENLVEDITLALTLADEAVNTHNVAPLEDAALHLDRLLGSEMPRLDAAIAMAANDLDLERLAGKLDSIREALAPGQAEVNELANTSNSLQRLHALLRDHVTGHNRWQRIDNDIRFVWQRLRVSIEGILANWRMLRRRLLERCENSKQEWAEQLQEAISRLDGFLGTGDKNRVLAEFIEIQHLAGEQFAIADRSLLSRCDELRPMAVGMQLLMKALT